MIRAFIESLETRQFLSVSLPHVSAPQDAPEMVMAASPVAAATKVIQAVGNYSCTAKFDGEPGLMILKITSQKSIAVSGSLYSMDWGGFNIAITGTIDAQGTLTLKGSNKTFKLKRFTVQVASNAASLTGSCSIVQMGISATAKVKLGKLSKAPPRATPAKAPSLLGSYNGTAYSNTGDHPNSVSLAFTKQDGGHIWGKDDQGEAITGVVLKDGRFRLITRESDGYTIITGKLQKKGVLTGDWAWFGQDGPDSGTFKLRRA